MAPRTQHLTESYWILASSCLLVRYLSCHSCFFTCFVFELHIKHQKEVNFQWINRTFEKFRRLCKTFPNAAVYLGAPALTTVGASVMSTRVTPVTLGHIKPGSAELHRGHKYFLPKCQQSVSEATQGKLSGLGHCVTNWWRLVTWCPVVLCKHILPWPVISTWIENIRTIWTTYSTRV